MTKGTNQGVPPVKRIAIVCVSVAVVALLLAASAVPVFAASKKSSETTNEQTTGGGTTGGSTTGGGTTSDGSASPDAVKQSSATNCGDTLINAVQSPSPKNNVLIVLEENSRNACDGPANGVLDQLPSGFKIKTINAPDFNCSGVGTDTAECSRNTNYNKAYIKIKAKTQNTGRYQNEAQDTYNNYTYTNFRVTS